MPKGESRMSLLAGSSINLTWHLGYPHRGHYYQIISRTNISYSMLRTSIFNCFEKFTCPSISSQLRLLGYFPVQDIFHDLYWMLRWLNHSILLIVQCSIFCTGKQSVPVSERKFLNQMHLFLIRSSLDQTYLVFLYLLGSLTGFITEITGCYFLR